MKKTWAISVLLCARMAAGCNRTDRRIGPDDRNPARDSADVRPVIPRWGDINEKQISAALAHIDIATCVTGEPLDSRSAEIVVATTGSVVELDLTPEVGGFSTAALRRMVLGQLVTAPYAGPHRAVSVYITRADMRRDAGSLYKDLAPQHRIVTTSASRAHPAAAASP
jgi:hypothetical protein